MRKQNARGLLAVAVLPLSALVLHGLPASSPAALHNSTSTISRHIAALDAALATPGTLPPATGPGTSTTATTALSGVANGVANANGQVLSRAHQIEQTGSTGPSRHSTSATPTTSAPPAPAQSPAPRPQPPQDFPAPPSSESAILACIRDAESGDNYADTSNPYYRGAYQFSYSTWSAVGGTGDPATASPAEQDMRAGMLVANSGWGQWSTAAGCGAPV